MVRCFPAELTECQITEFVDVLRREIGPLRYARFLIEEDQNRNDTVGFISFYNVRENERCINRMFHRLQLMLPYDDHYVQFKANHDWNHKAFDKWATTQLRIYDLRDELVRFAIEYLDPNDQAREQVDDETSFEEPQSLLPVHEQEERRSWKNSTNNI